MQSDAIISTSEQNIEKRDQETESQLSEEKIEKKSWIPNWWSNNEKSEARIRSTDPLGSSHVEDNVREIVFIINHLLMFTGILQETKKYCRKLKN